MAMSEVEIKRIRETRENRLHQQLLDDLRVVLSTCEGLHVLGRILGETRVDHSEFLAEPEQMYFRAGERHMGVFIKSLIRQANPDKWMEMVRQYEKISQFYTTGGEAELDAALAAVKLKGKTRLLEIKS